MHPYREHLYPSADGLELFARDYAHPSPRATLLCLPGLTANSADFEGFAARFGETCRIVAPDLRGRGRSPFGNPLGLPIGVLDVHDVLQLAESLMLDDLTLLGTSMSAWTAMTLAAIAAGAPLGPLVDDMRARFPAARRLRVRGVILNDLGPELSPAGIAAGRDFDANAGGVRTWDDAAREVRRGGASEAPGMPDEFWMQRARARYRENAEGIPTLAYDPAILPQLPPAEADDAPAPPPPGIDVWPIYQAMGSTPTLVLRGALSRTFTDECLKRMLRDRPVATAASIPNRGHCPMLDEPESVSAIETFLDALG